MQEFPNKKPNSEVPFVGQGIPMPNVLLTFERGRNRGKFVGDISPSLQGTNTFYGRDKNETCFVKTGTSSADWLSLTTSTNICTIPFTYILRFQVNSANTTEILESNANAINQSVEIQISNGNQVDFNNSNIAALIASPAGIIKLNTWHTIGLSYDGTNGLMFVDGVHRGTCSSSRTWTHGTFALGGARSGTSADQPNKISFFAMWPTILEAKQLQKLSENPWRMFYQPSIKRKFLNSIAAGGAFNPYWAINSNQLIQPGVAIA